MNRTLCVALVMSILCAGVFAAEPDKPMTAQQIQTLRLVVGALAAQLMRLVAAVNEEEIGPSLRAEIKNTIESCLAILNALGYMEKALGGTHG